MFGVTYNSYVVKYPTYIAILYHPKHFYHQFTITSLIKAQSVPLFLDSKVSLFSNGFHFVLQPFRSLKISSDTGTNFSNLLDIRNLQEQVKKAFCYQKLFRPFTVWINCSSNLKSFANYRPSASNSKSFSQSLGQFIQTVRGKNNFW